MLIGSKQAVEIVKEVAGGKPDRTVLKRWSDTGRIKRVAVHAKCALYDADEVRQAAKTARIPKSTLGEYQGLEVAR